MANKLYSMEDVKKNCENNQTWVVINKMCIRDSTRSIPWFLGSIHRIPTVVDTPSQHYFFSWQTHCRQFQLLNSVLWVAHDV